MSTVHLKIKDFNQFILDPKAGGTLRKSVCDVKPLRKAMKLG